MAEIESMVAAAGERLGRVTEEFSRVVVGQEELRTGLLTALLCDGHVLIEGVPGLAKTLAAYTLSRCISGTFQRIQFTPDLMPADITGTLIYQQNTGSFVERMGRSPEGHLAFLHGFQKRALHLGRGPVDLIRQDKTAEDGPAFGLEFTGPLVIDERAGNIGREQIRCELDAPE